MLCFAIRQIQKGGMAELGKAMHRLAWTCLAMLCYATLTHDMGASLGKPAAPRTTCCRMHSGVHFSYRFARWQNAHATCWAMASGGDDAPSLYI